jgi:hypothetical protein
MCGLSMRRRRGARGCRAAASLSRCGSVWIAVSRVVEEALPHRSLTGTFRREQLADLAPRFLVRRTRSVARR